MAKDAETRILCFGAGGHAAVVIDLLQHLAAVSALAIAGIVAKDGPENVLGIPVLGSDGDLGKIIRETGASHFIVGVGSVRGGGGLRPHLYALGVEAGLVPFTAIHPTAIVAPSARLGPGSTVMAGAVVQARCAIGANVIVNTRASLDHDCRVGDHAHVAPGATCSGGVTIGQGAHVGTGAVIIENRTIANGATLGAGSVLISDCGADEIWLGVPARNRSLA